MLSKKPLPVCLSGGRLHFSSIDRKVVTPKYIRAIVIGPSKIAIVCYTCTSKGNPIRDGVRQQCMNPGHALLSYPVSNRIAFGCAGVANNCNL
jgi:hypothetical protein